MAHLTGNFLAESPLSARTRQALEDALDQGWHDPRKLSQASARARILLNSALESLGASLHIRPCEIEAIGEPGLAPYLAIGGLLQPGARLVHSSIDRKEVLAIARNLPSSLELAVDQQGKILLASEKIDFEGVLSLQGANAETGVIQDISAIAESVPSLRIACDYMSAGAGLPLPARWDCAYFDAKSWQGPSGVGFLAIQEGSAWKNPLPHLSNLRSPQTASLPLTLAAAVALEEWIELEKSESSRIRQLTQELRSEIVATISDCDLAGNLSDSLPHISSASFLYVQGEELLRSLESRGFNVDSGSACTADDLKPSHVLAAMGLLTHGNIRITIHHGTEREEVLELVSAIRVSVAELRSS